MNESPLENATKHNEFLAIVNGFTKLTIAMAVVAFVVCMVLTMRFSFTYGIVVALIIFVFVYAIAFFYSRKKIVGKIVDIEATTGKNLDELEFYRALKRRPLLLESAWSLKTRK